MHYEEAVWHNLTQLVEAVGEATAYQDFPGTHAKHRQCAARARKHARWILSRLNVRTDDPDFREKIAKIFGSPDGR